MYVGRQGIIILAETRQAYPEKKFQPRIYSLHYMNRKSPHFIIPWKYV